MCNVIWFNVVNISCYSRKISQTDLTRVIYKVDIIPDQARWSGHQCKVKVTIERVTSAYIVRRQIYPLNTHIKCLCLSLEHSRAFQIPFGLDWCSKHSQWLKWPNGACGHDGFMVASAPTPIQSKCVDRQDFR